jgi:hypothetical protein
MHTVTREKVGSGVFVRFLLRRWMALYSGTGSALTSLNVMMTGGAVARSVYINRSGLTPGSTVYSFLEFYVMEPLAFVLQRLSARCSCRQASSFVLGTTRLQMLSFSYPWCNRSVVRSLTNTPPTLAANRTIVL